MKLTIAKEVLKTNIKAQLSGKPAQPVVFSGLPGIGKTRSIQTIAEESGCKFLHYSIPELTSELLSGLTTTMYA